MAVDFELPSREADTTEGDGTQDTNRQPPQGSTQNTMPHKPRASYVPYVPHTPLGQHQPPQQVDFQTIPPETQSRSLFGNRNGKPRPRWLVVAVVFRSVLLVASLSFLAIIIVLAAAFSMFCWGWLAAGIVSFLADLTAVSLPVLAYKHRRPVAIAHTVLDAVAIALFIISVVPGMFWISYGSWYDREGQRRTGNGLASAASLFAICMMKVPYPRVMPLSKLPPNARRAARIVSMLISFGTSFYDTNRNGWWSPSRPLSAGPVPLIYRV